MSILHYNNKNCCGCSACMNICPENAIIMNPDDNGYIFPKIIAEKCSECGICREICDFQKPTVTGNEPKKAYAAINKDRDILSRSSSGGAFGGIASFVFGKGGIVFGCAYNCQMEPEHIYVDNPEEIKKIQGSKYAQSYIGASYKKVRYYLEKQKWVLFSGTPCQVAALKSYLGKDYYNLLTVDIICHGVPSAHFFKGYIKYLEEKHKIKVTDFNFRDKTRGWGYLGKVRYEANGKTREKHIKPYFSYYYYYFLKGYVLRDSYYKCKYACSHRVADFTIGDYWGIKDVHPDIDVKSGVSVLLVNTNKGNELVDELKKYLYLTESNLDMVIKRNAQLTKPMPETSERGLILSSWRNGGYNEVAEEFYKANKRGICMQIIKSLVPRCVRKFLKGIISWQ